MNSAPNRARPLSVAVAAGVSGSLLLGATAAADGNCIHQNAVLRPGGWQSRTIAIEGTVDDGIASEGIFGTGAFWLDIDNSGVATGQLTLDGSASSVMDDDSDVTSSQTTFNVTADVGGTGANLLVEGSLEASITGVIDVSGADGVGFGEGSNEHPEFENSITRPWTARLIPTSTSCNTAIGHIGGGNQPEASGPLWFAYRTSDSPDGRSLEEAFADLIEHGEQVGAADPIDPEQLKIFVYEALAFDAALAAAAKCTAADLGGLAAGNPAYDFLHEVVNTAMETMADAALNGEYDTEVVIYLTALWLGSGALGWRGSGPCLQPNGSDERAGRIYGSIEQTLINRYAGLRNSFDAPLTERLLSDDDETVQEMTEIAVAAYQFGMQSLMAEVEAR